MELKFIKIPRYNCTTLKQVISIYHYLKFGRHKNLPDFSEDQLKFYERYFKNKNFIGDCIGRIENLKDLDIKSLEDNSKEIDTGIHEISEDSIRKLILLFSNYLISNKEINSNKMVDCIMKMAEINFNTNLVFYQEVC